MIKQWKEGYAAKDIILSIYLEIIGNIYKKYEKD